MFINSKMPVYLMISLKLSGLYLLLELSKISKINKNELK